MSAIVALQLCQESASAAAERKRILYLGDSMSMGAFGRKLDKEMREDGFDVYTFVAGGATPYYWLSRYSTIKGPIGYWEKTPGGEQRENVARGVPKVETLLERFDPDVVVVQTGTNLYSALRSKRRSKENNVKEVEGLLSHMVEAATQGGRSCYWITPPAAHPDRYPFELQAELAELTKRVVSCDAKVFDSRKVTKYTDPYPANDGIHYGPTEASQWASLVVEDFREFMGSRPPTHGGMLAGGQTLNDELEPVAVDYREIPRAIPVSSTAKVAATGSGASMASVSREEPRIAEAIPPSKPRKKFRLKFRSRNRSG
ncbi:MAG: SGNH/GDSL hydrolase family protein, partial [Verrucomicrobiales bacterium]